MAEAMPPAGAGEPTSGPPDPRPRSIRLLARVGRPMLAVAIAGIVALLFVQTGSLADTQATLVEMGFDPDRARLIAALLAAAAATAAATLVTGRRAVAIVAGSLAFGVLFRRTFQRETADALHQAAPGVQFDPVGWALTVAALAAMAVAATWAAAVLAGTLRAGALAGLPALGRAVRDRRPSRAALRAGAGAAAVLAVVALLPVMSDMVNFSPDARMARGADPGIGLFAAGGTPGPADARAGRAAAGSDGGAGRASVAGGAHGAAGASVEGGRAPAASGSGSGAPGGGAAGGAPASGSSGTARPWTAWRPQGAGRIVATTFPGPWVGGSVDVLHVSVYLPPGYDTGTRAYPVVYELPWSLDYWDRSVQMPAMLDGLIDAGTIPPEVVVFVSAHGGPYPDSECVDSADGREWFETFFTTSLVPWVDGHYRTLATAESRTLFGFSAGGYCAANLLMKHPDLFTDAIAISGYYTAGLRSGQTINAWRPFGNDPARLAANTPMTTCAQLPEAIRHDLFVALSGDPSEPLYGQQMQEFGTALSSAGVQAAWLPVPIGHAWSAAREALPQALAAVAEHQAAEGVFAAG